MQMADSKPQLVPTESVDSQLVSMDSVDSQTVLTVVANSQLVSMDSAVVANSQLVSMDSAVVANSQLVSMDSVDSQAVLMVVANSQLVSTVVVVIVQPMLMAVVIVQPSRREEEALYVSHRDLRTNTKLEYRTGRNTVGTRTTKSPSVRVARTICIQNLYSNMPRNGSILCMFHCNPDCM
jgi:hypothetical protein